MAQKVSSIVLSVEARSADHNPFVVHLVDPHRSIARLFPSTCKVSCVKAPVEPYDVDSQSARPRKRPRIGSGPRCREHVRKAESEEEVGPLDAHRPAASLASIGFAGFSGRARQTRAQAVPPEAAAKEPVTFNKGAADEAAHHARIAPMIRSCLAALEQAVRSGGDVPKRPLPQLELVDNKTVGPEPPWAGITRDAEDDGPPFLGAFNVDAEPALRRVTSYEKSTAPVWLPSRSGFCLATMERFVEAAAKGKAKLGVESFDLVIIDPPWENASAQRSSSYSAIELYDLFKIDLPAVLGKNDHKPALVAVWVTNRPKFRRFLLNKFLPDSNVRGPYVEWYWVKVTDPPDEAIGQPVFNLNSDSPRRCYEGLVMGWYHASPELEIHSPLPPLPPLQMFVSPPLGHSRKPDVLDLLSPYLPEASNVLELFARAVGSVPQAPGKWLSVGNEACKFNAEPWVTGSEN